MMMELEKFLAVTISWLVLFQPESVAFLISIIKIDGGSQALLKHFHLSTNHTGVNSRRLNFNISHGENQNLTQN
jgi:hypothetical protein